MTSLPFVSLVLPLLLLAGWAGSAVWLTGRQRYLQQQLDSAAERYDMLRDDLQRAELANGRQVVELGAERERTAALQRQLEANRELEAELRQQTRQAQLQAAEQHALAEATRAQLQGIQEQLAEVRERQHREQQLHA